MNQGDGDKPPSDEQYLEALRWKRAQIADKLQELEREREEIAAKAAQVTNEMRAINALLSSIGIEGRNDASVSISDNQGGSVPDRAKGGLFVRTDIPDLVFEAVEQTLKRAGEPMHYKELAAVVQHLAPLRGKDPSATLLAHLSRAPHRFKRVWRGTYWLASEEQKPKGSLPPLPGVYTTKRKKRRRKRSK